MRSNLTASRRLFLKSAGALMLAPAALRAGRAAEIFPDQTLQVDGIARRYRLVVPASAGANPPLMIALHGMLIDSPSLMPTYSGLDDMARANGSVLVYPKSFDSGWPLSFGPKLQRELRFLDALVGEMQRTRNTNPQRIYLLGMSNGGYFAVVVASRRSQYLAGLAVHSGTAGVMGFGFETKRKFPVFVAHGSADPIINIRDGRYLADLFRRLNHPTEFADFP
ncbi:MAG: PHB depolymerase family esterase, partial [Micropepsaceae bacterium]